MSTSRIVSQMPLPPPRLIQLLDGTGAIGWIDAHRVQFTGFADPAEAAAAAWVAHVGLERRRAKTSREAPPPLESPRLFLVRSGGHEWITVEGKRLARLLRPNQHETSPNSNVASDSSARWFGIEIAFTPEESELTVRSSAYVMYLALRRSGLPWSARLGQFVLTPARAASNAEETGIAPRSGRAHGEAIIGG